MERDRRAAARLPPFPPAVAIETNQDYWGVDFAITDSNFKFASFVDETLKVFSGWSLEVAEGCEAPEILLLARTDVRQCSSVTIGVGVNCGVKGRLTTGRSARHAAPPSLARGCSHGRWSRP